MDHALNIACFQQLSKILHRHFISYKNQALAFIPQTHTSLPRRSEWIDGLNSLLPLLSTHVYS